MSSSAGFRALYAAWVLSLAVAAVSESHVGSDKHARAVIDGLDADSNAPSQDEESIHAHRR
jgi:ABC-type sulfate transport system substrate-binding protein